MRALAARLVAGDAELAERIRSAQARIVEDFSADLARRSGRSLLAGAGMIRRLRARFRIVRSPSEQARLDARLDEQDAAVARLRLRLDEAVLALDRASSTTMR